MCVGERKGGGACPCWCVPMPENMCDSVERQWEGVFFFVGVTPASLSIHELRLQKVLG